MLGNELTPSAQFDLKFQFDFKFKDYSLGVPPNAPDLPDRLGRLPYSKGLMEKYIIRAWITSQEWQLFLLFTRLQVHHQVDLPSGTANRGNVINPHPV